MGRILSLIGASLSKYRQDRALMMAAALAYYTVIAIAPMITIIIGALGNLVEQRVAASRIIGITNDIAGPQVARVVAEVLSGAGSVQGTMSGTIISVAITLIAATALFAHLQDAMDVIWGVTPPAGSKRKRIGEFLHKRFISLVLMTGILLLLLFSLMVTATLNSMINLADGVLPSGLLLPFLGVGNHLLTFALITVLFMLVYSLMPRERIGLGNVWLGALVTAGLFVIGQVFIGLYFSVSPVGTAFGIAGAVVAVMVWIYYSSVIFLFGAEFTKVHTDMSRRP